MAQGTTNSGRGGPNAVLVGLINGFMASRVVHVAAELGIADLLADGPKPSEALAGNLGACVGSLNRLLRALASLGVLDELEPGLFALNELGTQLRAGVPGSMRNLALMFGSDRFWRTWGELRDSITTGDPVFPRLFGMQAFEYLARDPKQGAIFNQAMAEVTRQVTSDLVAGYDFTPFSTIVDVGGGNGTLMTSILKSAPKLRGIVFDSPNGSAQASQLLRETGLGERCEVIAGDFFRSVPKGADAYILKSIIHDWDDERSGQILKSCRDAISPNGKLLVVERVMPAKVDSAAGHQRWTMLDLHMLVMLGGRERTEDEYRALFATADFKLERVQLLPGATGFSVIEASPV